MAREVGDLWPQVSGSSSLGAEMTNGGFTGAMRPFAGVFMNSGVWHNPTTGASGVIRFQLSQENVLTTGEEVFGFSSDGGLTFHLQLGDNTVGNGGQGADVVAPFGAMRVIGSGGFLGAALGTNAAVQLWANDGALNIIAFGDGVSSRGQVNLTATQDINLSPFSGSGQLEYRFGPHQSWYIKQSHKSNGGPNNDGYWPIAHSGQVAAMIAIASGNSVSLQNAYVGGDEITVASRPSLTPRGILLKTAAGSKITLPEDDINVEHGYGIAVSGFSSVPSNVSSYGIAMLTINALDVRGSGSNMPNFWAGVDQTRQHARISTSGTLRINAGSGLIITAPTIFMASGLNRPPLGISGVFISPREMDRIGDLFMQNHSFLDVGIVNDQATANAKAMGVGELVLQTGSGTINVSVGSGIAQFLQLSVMDITTVEQNIPFDAVNYQCSDKNFQCGTEAAGTSGQVTIFSPGLYKADFKIQSTKIVGTNPQTCRYRALLNGSALLGGICNSFHYDITNAPTNSGYLSILFNANAGDKFSVGILSTLAGADNCRLVTRAALLILQRIGPKRGTF